MRRWLSRRPAPWLVGGLLVVGLAACGDFGSAAYLPQPSPVPTLARLATVTPAPPTRTPAPTRTPIPPTPTPAPPTPEPVLAIVNVVAANVRAGPGTNFDVVGFLELGNEVPLLAQSEGWYGFALPDGSTGWVAAELLLVDEAAAATLPPPP